MFFLNLFLGGFSRSNTLEQSEIKLEKNYWDLEKFRKLLYLLLNLAKDTSISPLTLYFPWSLGRAIPKLKGVLLTGW